MKGLRRNTARKGFTLIELMIVIAIIGVLAGIAVPNYQEARKKAQLKACWANQKTIAGAVEMYNLDKGTSEHDLTKIADELVKGGYLQNKVNDPGSGDSSFSHYTLTDDGLGITCTIHGSLNKKDSPTGSSGS